MSQAQLDSARGLAGDFEKMTKKSAELAATFKTDGQWCKWYQVLAEYFPEHRPENELAGQNLTITFHALGWARLTAAYISGRSHWLLWTICVIVIASSLLYAFRFMYTPDIDPAAYKLSARLLASIRGENRRRDQAE